MQIKRQCMAAFVVVPKLGFAHAAAAAPLQSASWPLGNPCRRSCLYFPPGRTYRQLFQVDVTFAFVSAYQVTLSIVMAKEEEDRKGVCLSIAIQLQSTTVSAPKQTSKQ
jgi:hypothetical protein